MPARAYPLSIAQRFVRDISMLGVTLICAACAVPPVGTPLQSNATAAAPTVTAGDTWTYAVRDGYTGLPRPTEIFTVTGANQNQIDVTADTGGAREAQVYDGNWDWLKRSAMNINVVFTYNPAYQAFAFPLVPGKKWRQRLVATEQRNGMRYPVWIDATVLGWERIKVPAGEFDAIRVRRFVVFGYLDYSDRGRTDTTEDEWYAPAVKQVVRRESNGMYQSFIHSALPGFIRTGTSDDGGPGMIPDDWLVKELVSYSVR